MTATITTEDFISHFHSLSGTTIGERKKNLFILLNRIETATNNYNEIDFSSIHPNNPLEEAFQVEIFIHFRMVRDLIKVLESENPILIKKVLDAGPWFLEELLKTTRGDDLVNLIFPYVSFNVKIKILNKLSIYLKDTEVAECIFNSVHVRYGLYLSTKLLPSCSKNFILKAISNHRLKLTAKNLLVIIKKYPDTSPDVFKALNSYMTNADIESKYQKVFVYLSNNHQKEFLNLYKEYKPRCRLGWRATQKLIDENKEVVIKEAENIYRYLHKKQTVKSLKNNFIDFYVKLFPSSIQHFPGSLQFLYSFLTVFRTDEERFQYLEESFKRNYEMNLLDNINPVLLDVIPLSKLEEIKQKPPLISEDKWNSYSKIEKSIPYLKKRISLSSDRKSREDLIEHLVFTCKINEDKVALLNVFKYVINQHRNDHVCVRQRFLTSVRNYFVLEQLNEECWSYINELLTIFGANNEYYYDHYNFLIDFIHYKLLNGLNIKEDLIKFISFSSFYWNFNLFQHIPAFEKQCLLLFGELIQSGIFTEENILKRLNIIFLRSLVDWNQRHPKDEISLFDYPIAIDSFKEALLKNEIDIDTQQAIMKYLMKYKLNVLIENNLFRLFLSKYPNRNNNKVILNFILRNHPLLVLSNISVISELLLKCLNISFWKQCKNYFHLEIPQQMADFYAKDFHTKTTRQNNLITALALLLNDKFLDLASDYYPKQLRGEYSNSENQDLYKFQSYIANALKNLIPASLVLESLLHYCKGDYLKLILKSLYSITGNVNENKLPTLFGELGKRAVSVRKHAFHLTLRVLDRRSVFDVFKRFMAIEKDSSIKKFLVKGSFSLFLQDPDDNIWELIESTLEMADVNDLEVASLLVNTMDLIPSEYIVRYFLYLWNYLGKLPDGDGMIESKKYEILCSLSPEKVQNLPMEFCLKIIKDNFLNEDGSTVNRFVSKFIIYSEDELENRLNVIFPIISDCIQDRKHRYMIYSFVRDFCSEFLTKRCLTKSILLMFISTWDKFINPPQAFDQYLYLNFSLISVDAENLNWPPNDIGQKLAEFINSLAEVYSVAIAGVVCDILRSFVPNFSCTDKIRYALIEGMIKNSRSTTCLIAAISLLKRNLDNSKVQVKHDEMVRYFSAINDPIVEIHLNHHLH